MSNYGDCTLHQTENIFVVIYNVVLVIVHYGGSVGYIDRFKQHWKECLSWPQV